MATICPLTFSTCCHSTVAPRWFVSLLHSRARAALSHTHTQHDYHHETFVYNFASRFTVLDRIFGTYKEPPGDDRRQKEFENAALGDRLNAHSHSAAASTPTPSKALPSSERAKHSPVTKKAHADVPKSTRKRAT